MADDRDISALLDALALPKEQVQDYRTIGSSGLKRYGGFISEERLRQLFGVRGLRVYQDMLDDDAVCGSSMNTVDKVVRQVKWHVKPASDKPNDLEARDFIQECINDMDMTWTDNVSEFLSMLPFGFSLHETVYKQRCGPGGEPWQRSKYNDGRIGWRGMPIRSQDTIHRWNYDQWDQLESVEQIAPPLNQRVIIPMEKLLLFRTSVHKNNPLGRSIYRNAWRSYYMKRAMENIEGVGAERDLAGLPFAFVPPEIMSPTAPAQAKALYERIKQIVSGVKRDEEEGVVFPMAYDANGNRMFDFQLLTSGGARAYDTDKIIQRYDQRIAMSIMTDFLLLGQGATASGSWAMHSDKTKMFLQACRAYLGIIKEVINRYAIPRLMSLNTFPVTDYPEIEHDKLEEVDLRDVGDFLQKMAASGAQIFGNPEIDNWVCEVAGAPSLTNPEKQEQEDNQEIAQVLPTQITQLHDEQAPTAQIANPEPGLPR